MRARILLGGVLASTAVILGSFEAGQTLTAASTSASHGTSTTSTSGAYTDGTYTGSDIATRYGDVQVQVTVSGGAITDVTALQLTDDDGRSVQISAQAAPLLRQEVLSAQTASVDTISGATYTTEGYLQSLQAALDQAH